MPYAEFSDPQSLNLYSYVRNIPTSLVDGDGHSMGALSNEGFEGFESFWEKLAPGPPDKKEQKQQQTQQQQTQSQQQQQTQNPPATNGYASISSVSATSSDPGTAIGGIIGELINPEVGGIIGSLLGSTVGVGPNVSYVPSTQSWFAGPMVSFTPAINGGSGISGNVVFVPPLKAQIQSQMARVFRPLFNLFLSWARR